MKENRPYKKTKRLIAFLTWLAINLFPHTVSAQTTCAASVNLNSGSETTSLISPGRTWFTFTGDPGNHYIVLSLVRPAANPAVPVSLPLVDTLELDSGSCSSLTLVTRLISTQARGKYYLPNLTFVSGRTYYLKVHTTCSGCSYEINASLFSIYGPSNCDGSCNLSCNGDLENTTPNANGVLPISFSAATDHSGCWDVVYDAGGPVNYYDINAYAEMGTPDLFSSNCALTAFDDYCVPTNEDGSASAFSGSGYAGIYAYEWNQGYSQFSPSQGGYNYREYLQQTMCDSMIAGHKYKVSFRVQLADSSAFATKLGVLLKDDTLMQTFTVNGSPGNVYTAANPQYTTGFITNTSSWQLVSFVYTATANMKQIAIGNFNKDSSGYVSQQNTHLHVDYSSSGSIPMYMAYYYLDSVNIVPIDSVKPNMDTVLLCRSQSDTLKAALGGPNPNVSYYWTSSPADASLSIWLGSHPSDSIVVISPSTSTTYYVTLTDNMYNCSYIDSFHVIVGGVVIDSIYGNHEKCDTLAQYVVHYQPSNANAVINWYTSSSDPISSNGNDTVIVHWKNTIASDSWLYVTITDTLTGCVATDSMLVHLCCIPAGGGTLVYNDTSSVVLGYTTAHTFTSVTLKVNGTFWIDQDLKFITSKIEMGPNAKIIVIAGHTLELQETIVRAGCCEMWDAIIGDSLLDSVVVHHLSYIGDGIRGVVSNQGSVFRFYDRVTCNRNLVSITVNPYAGNHGGTVQETTFSSSNPAVCPTTSPSGSLLPPYSGQWPLFGIFITNVDSITIGNYAAAADSNVFIQLRYGIRSVKSNVKIYNNRFNGINKAGTVSKAIWSCGRFPTLIPFNLTQYSVVVGGTAAGRVERNLFTNCSNGVFTDTAMSTTVKGCMFQQTTTMNGIGVRIHNCMGLVRIVDIINDTFYNQRYSVYLYQNNNCTTRVWGNYMKRTLAGTTGCTGVFANYNGNNSGTLSVYLNEIDNVQYGVWFANVKKASADNNYIYIRPTTSAIFNARGVSAVNCVGVLITNNQIRRESPTSSAITSNWIGGIYFSHCSGAKVTCNLIQKLGYGVQATGSGSTNSTVFRNEMTSTKYGIWLSNGAIIGQQGSTTVANDNTWSGTITYRLYTSGNPITNGNFSKFYYRPSISSIYFPSPLNHALGSFNIPITQLSSAPSIQPCHYFQTPSGSAGQNGLIANGQITFTGNQDAGTWLSRESLYRLFEVDTTIGVGDSLMMVFKDSADASNLGLLMYGLMINSTDTLNPTAPKDVLDSITAMTPGDNVEQHYKTVEMIMLYHQFYGDTLSAADIDSLQMIAALCPFTEGNAVYLARALLVPYDTTEYQNDCDTIDSTYNRMANPYVQQTSPFKVYPNPSNGTITVDYELSDTETGTLQIFTMTGAFVSSIPLESGRQVKSVTLSQLQSGVYIYKITVNGEMRKVDRLIIIE